MEKIDLSSNSKSIKDAYEKVIRGNGATYSVFSVDKSGTLEVTKVSTGDLDDFVDDFSDGVVQFGLAKVNVPGSDVSKNLLLGWCPDNAPAKSRLSYAANFADVSKVLSGYHVQITARDQDDLNVEEFVSRVAAAAGARYTAHSATSNVTLSKSGLNMPRSKPDASSAFKSSTLQAKGKPILPASSKPSSSATILRNQATVGDEDDEWAGEKEIEERDFEKQPLDLVPSAYKPTKVDINQLRQQKSDTISSKPKPFSSGDDKAKDDNITKSLNDKLHISELPADGRLTSMPKPRVGSSVASRYTAATAGAKFGSKPVTNSKQDGKDKVAGGLSRDFGSTGGKTPAQLWAEKKGMYKDVKVHEPGAHGDAPNTENEGVKSELKENLESSADDTNLPSDAQTHYEREDDDRDDDDGREEDEPQENTGLSETQVDLSARRSESATQARPTAIAAYDYDKDEDNELEFREDDRIVDIDFVDEEWWSGTNERTGEVGLFPASYVTMVEDENDNDVDDDDDHGVQTAVSGTGPEVASDQNTKSAVAEFSYEKDEDNEISFAEGDLITDIEFVDESWWSGRNSKSGEVGLFPANYVNLN